MASKLNRTAWTASLNFDGMVPQDDGKGDRPEDTLTPIAFDLGDWTETPPEAYLSPAKRELK